MITLFEKEYGGESLYDLSNDIADALEEEYNERIKNIPTDEHGLHTGTFTVKIEWKEG